MALAEDFQQVLDGMPSDWTDLELDLRIEDESRVRRHRRRPQPDQRAGLLAGRIWVWRLLVAKDFGHAAAAETVLAVLSRLDADGVAGELAVREVREGRSEIVPRWGRPESVREEFRQRRAI